MLKLACGSDVPPVALGVGLVCITALLGCFLLILLSYAFIVAAILKIPSAEGRHKAFSTCASHLTVVIVHYGFASVIYLKPKGPKSLEGDTLMGITYTVLTPFLSPIIFSLRNKELKLSSVLYKCNLSAWASKEDNKSKASMDYTMRQGISLNLGLTK
ncbi:olfactory receptor 10H1-like protein [Cricetulus griseus]|uniref:Olfactory receptor 10H1-like protein n=1 Tax=Cricetulus griseus TaxID=10029 RepID=A0A061I4P1_CRIGR|nr:olfactory receptor 10H1-like protein [Cricetulus griseus]